MLEESKKKIEEEIWMVPQMHRTSISHFHGYNYALKKSGRRQCGHKRKPNK